MKSTVTRINARQVLIGLAEDRRVQGQLMVYNVTAPAPSPNPPVNTPDPPCDGGPESAGPVTTPAPSPNPPVNTPDPPCEITTHTKRPPRTCVHYNHSSVPLCLCSTVRLGRPAVEAPLHCR
eukprot:1186076-Prorocentrum_minimum.AAC.1